MPSTRNTTKCVVTEASWQRNGSYMLHMCHADNPNSASTKFVQKTNDIAENRCLAPLPFVGFPNGARCQRGFKSGSLLKAHHKAVHHLEPLPAPTAGYSFLDGSNYDKHIRVCKNRPAGPVKQYDCQLCGNVFPRSDNFQRHKKTCKGRAREQEQEYSEEVVALATANVPATAARAPMFNDLSVFGAPLNLDDAPIYGYEDAQGYNLDAAQEYSFGEQVVSPATANAPASASRASTFNDLPVLGTPLNLDDALEYGFADAHGHRLDADSEYGFDNAQGYGYDAALADPAFTALASPTFTAGTLFIAGHAATTTPTYAANLADGVDPSGPSTVAAPSAFTGNFTYPQPRPDPDLFSGWFKTEKLGPPLAEASAEVQAYWGAISPTDSPSQTALC